jgi:lysophospholipid acyltransferase (LPLAT)-like uncharacterized protein
LLGIAIGLLARAWIASLRVESEIHPALNDHPQLPWVLALWHGQILPLLAFKLRRRTVALVSLSRDGDLLAWAFRVLGVASERGSSSAQGRKGLRQIATRLRSEPCDAAFAVDGPRGPRHRVQGGALAAARLCGGVVVPFVAACERVIALRSWDGFEIPWPFSRVVVVLGSPIQVGRGGVEPALLAQALDASEALAQSILHARGLRCCEQAHKENA